MNTADVFAMTHTNAALALFCKAAIEALQENGVKELPSCDELHKLIAERVFPDAGEMPSAMKAVPRDDVAVAKVEVEVPAPAPAPATIVQEQKGKFTSKDLKKNPLKIAKKELTKDGTEVEVEVEVEFPYVAGFDYSNTCQSIKLNGGLFTPCSTRKSKDSDFCKSCLKAGHKDGIFSERSTCSMLCYENSKGKKEISFGTWLSKRGLTRTDVQSKFEEHFGISLPEEYWSIDKSKASRAVKTVSTSSDDEASVEGEKPAPKKRGRPKKVKSVETTEIKAEVEPAQSTPSEELKEEPVAEEPAVEEPVSKEPAVEEPVSKEPAVEEPVQSISNDELKEEPVVEVASEESVEIEKKDGSLKKLSTDHTLVYWEGSTYIIDNDDNCVWSHDKDYELVSCVGEWDPDTKLVNMD